MKDDSPPNQEYFFEKTNNGLALFLNRITLLLLFLFSPIAVYASIIEDTTELQILLAQAELKIQDSPQEAFKLAKKVSENARNFGLYREHIKANRILGDYYIYTGNTDSAIFYYNESLKTSQEFDFQREEAINLIRLADGFVISRNIKLATEYYTKSLALAKLIEEDDLVVGIYNNKAVYYIYEKNWAEALRSLKQGLEFIKTSKKANVSIKGPFLSNIGVVYEEVAEYHKALDYHQQAHQVYELSNNIYNMALSWHNIGSAYLLLNKVDTAIQLLERAWQIEKENSISLLEQETLVRLSRAYLKKGNTQNAIEMAKNAVIVAKASKSINILAEAYYQLSLSYNASHEFIEGEKYSKLYRQLSDSLSLAKSKQSIMDEKFIEHDGDADSYTNKTAWMFVAFSLFSLSIFIFFKFLHRPKQVLIHDEKLTLNQPDFFLASNQSGNIPVKISQICWLEKEVKKCKIITTTDDFYISKTITEIESALSGHNFFRINRSVIINLDFFDGYSFWENDKYVVRLKGFEGKTFIMSRDRLKAFSKQLKLNEQ